MSGLPSSEELLARRREEDAKQAAEEQRLAQLRADLEPRLRELAESHAALVSDFVSRARELKIAPQRARPEPLTSWTVGSVVWADGWRTSIGVVSAPPLTYGVMKKPKLGSRLKEAVRQVSEVSTFQIFQNSDHSSAQAMSGPHPVLVYPTLRPYDIPQLPSMIEQAAKQVDELRVRLENDLIQLMR